MSCWTRDFPEPASVEEAQDRREELTAAMRMIEFQLSNGDRTDETGRRLTFQEWNKWRANALYAKAQKTSQASHLKQWIIARKAEADGALGQRVVRLEERLASLEARLAHVESPS